MADLIERKSLLKAMEDECDNAWWFCEQVENAPRIDAEPVVHAHWVYSQNANDWGIGGWCCSNCHYKNDVLGIAKELRFPIKMFAGTAYCPNCGAKMDEEVDDDKN